MNRAWKIARGLIEILAVGLVYLVLAKFGLWAAYGESYASAVWPAAGAAWASLLILGPRAAAGVWLGTFVVHLMEFHAAAFPSPNLWLGPTGIALSSTLQALTGYYLIRRVLGKIPFTVPEILRFVAIVTLASMLAPALGIPSSVWAGMIEPGNAATASVVWWLGDLAGILCVTPLSWLLASPEHRRIDCAFFPLITLSTGASLVLFLTLSAMQEEAVLQRFRREATNVAASFSRSLENRMLQATSLASYFNSSERVTGDEFRRFTTPILQISAYRELVAWLPRVTGEQRLQFEAEARREGLTDFQIKEASKSLELIPAGTRQEYFPILHVETSFAKPPAYGFDFASEPTRRAALEQMRANKTPTATASLRMISIPGRGKAVALMAPVFEGGKSSNPLSGFCVVIFEVGDLLGEALQYVKTEYIEVCIFDQTAGSEALECHRFNQPPPLNPNERPEDQFAKTLPVWGRKWELLCKATPEFYAKYRSLQPWGFLFSGLAFSGFLAAYAAVRQRTEAEVRRLNQELEAKVERRTGELRRSQEQFLAFMRNLPGFAFIKDRAGRYLYVSAASQRLFGKDPLEWIGKSDSELFPESREITVRDDWVLEHGLPVQVVETLPGTDGMHDWLVHKFPVFGIPVGSWLLGGIAVDITERKRAEDALRQSEEELAEAQRIARMGRWTWDFASGTADWNAQMSRIIGAPLGTQPSFELFLSKVHPEDVERIRQEWLEVTRLQKMPRPTLEYRIVREDQTVAHILTIAQIIRDEAGKPIRFTGTVQDITDLKETELKLEAALKKEATLRREIHHRVKNNLQVVSSLLFLQAAHVDDPITVEVLRECRVRVRSIALIHEKLYQSDEISQVDVAEYIDELVSELLVAYKTDTRRIATRVEVEQLSLSLDEAVPCGLIVTELVSNALKYAFPGERKGGITVTLGAINPEQLRLRVSDDGAGLPPGLNPERTGTLGLKLVHDLSRQLGGTLQFCEAEGACFEVLFPRPDR